MNDEFVTDDEMNEIEGLRQAYSDAKAVYDGILERLVKAGRNPTPGSEEFYEFEAAMLHWLATDSRYRKAAADVFPRLCMEIRRLQHTAAG